MPFNIIRKVPVQAKRRCDWSSQLAQQRAHRFRQVNITLRHETADLPQILGSSPSYSWGRSASLKSPLRSGAGSMRASASCKAKITVAQFRADRCGPATSGAQARGGFPGQRLAVWGGRRASAMIHQSSSLLQPSLGRGGHDTGPAPESGPLVSAGWRNPRAGPTPGVGLPGWLLSCM